MHLQDSVVVLTGATGGMGRALWTSSMAEPAVAVWPREPWDRPY